MQRSISEKNVQFILKFQRNLGYDDFKQEKKLGDCFLSSSEKQPNTACLNTKCQLMAEGDLN